MTRIIEVWPPRAIEHSGCFFVCFHDNLDVHSHLRLEDLESLQYEAYHDPSRMMEMPRKKSKGRWRSR
jgi:hypothetical protein